MRTTLSIIGTLCLMFVTALEAAPQCGGEPKREVVAHLEERLSRWEQGMAPLEARKETISERAYRDSEDLELALRDLRGELEELKSTCRTGWERLARDLENRMGETGQRLAELRSEVPKTQMAD